MKLKKTLADARGILGTLLLGLGLLLAWPTDMQSQSPPPQEGQNAVMTTTTAAAPSPAFVDALPYYSGDICSAIANILGSPNFYYNNSNGVVVDARGIGQGTTLTCSVNPWKNINSTTTLYANTVLLPAATIAIQATWIVPNATRVVGAGSGLTSSSGLTILKPASGFSGNMIDMGAGPLSIGTCRAGQCQAVVIEHLQLDGGSASGVNGILNGVTGSVQASAQELSYVNDVKFTNFNGFGLKINQAGNSGPYTKLYYSGTGPCVDILSAVETRGVHGLTCVVSQSPAIYVDGTNNSIEDVTIQATSSVTDGILIGSQAAAQSNILLNINGSGSSTGSLTNVIHINSASTSGIPNAADLTIMGVSRGSSTTNVILDDLTTTSLTDSQVAMYVLGEPLPTTPGFSRFTTSPNAPAWFVGASAPSGSSCSPGSLYSCTGGGCSPTLYGCTIDPTLLTPEWKAIE
jgi:hypothetical protein